MSLTYFVIPADFKYVLASLSLLIIVNIYIDNSVMRLRKTANVSLPQLFASPEEAAADPLKMRFNCAQKSSLNFSEHIGTVIIGSLVSGVYAPRLSAGFAALWAVSRVLYHTGYTTGNPKNRQYGFGSFIAMMSLSLCAVFFSIKSII